MTDTVALDTVLRRLSPATFHNIVKYGHTGDFWHLMIVKHYRRALASAAANEVGACRQPETANV